jgi:hypothetical protein
MFHSWIQKEADVPELGAKQTRGLISLPRRLIPPQYVASDDKEQIQQD